MRRRSGEELREKLGRISEPGSVILYRSLARGDDQALSDVGLLSTKDTETPICPAMKGPRAETE
jgi:predicted nucleotidyltransferase